MYGRQATYKLHFTGASGEQQRNRTCPLQLSASRNATDRSTKQAVGQGHAATESTGIATVSTVSQRCNRSKEQSSKQYAKFKGAAHSKQIKPQPYLYYRITVRPLTFR